MHIVSYYNMKSLFCKLTRYHNTILSSSFGRAALVRADTKLKTDNAKSKLYNRYAIKILMAVKAGGSDPEINKQLGQLISEAKSLQVPKDIINRNIEKAKNSNAVYKESMFEFFGHGKVGLLVSVLTDNDNRAAKSVLSTAGKHNLKPMAIGSVSFNFTKKARIEIVGSILKEEELLEICLFLSIDDYDLRVISDGNIANPLANGNSTVYVNATDMTALRDHLISKDYKLNVIGLRMIPNDGLVKLNEDDLDLNLNAIDALEELEDVDFVEHNIDLIR